MRKGIDERGPIAAWLIRSRGLFREPGATRAWTVDQFLAALEADTGWSPVRTTYARWESGAARPEADNLERVVAFYTARGVDGPDAPKESGEPSMAAALVMLAQELTALRLERTELAGRVERLEATVDRLAAESLAHAGMPAREAHDAHRRTGE